MERQGWGWWRCEDYDNQIWDVGEDNNEEGEDNDGNEEDEDDNEDNKDYVHWEEDNGQEDMTDEDVGEKIMIVKMVQQLWKTMLEIMKSKMKKKWWLKIHNVVSNTDDEMRC